MFFQLLYMFVVLVWIFVIYAGYHVAKDSLK